MAFEIPKLDYSGKIKEITMKGIERLAYRTWICHIWDNINMNKGITLNFTYMQSIPPNRALDKAPPPT